MSNKQLDKKTQDKKTQDKKEQNLQLIANSLQAEMAKDFLKQTENYDNKFKEIFDSLYETQELLLLSLDESKKASMNLSQIEIDARISKTLEDFEFTKKSVNKESNQSSLLPYIAIAVLFLAIGYFVKF
ncbi:hypothetical protein [Aliarcobacter cryaerophilus]|jgi:hypothetical protein|uniref:Uncharacterized protein n=2 Tax=unclassified Arcobacter TaxID=2593671 RepID=A0AA96I5V5_9BACT|nr:hypothetical protein [Aliarcobacter cryaerophilus]WNL11399.1 hypothetical protein RJG52_05545 [Arcobacter sp. AZ-2023]WPD10008.1 hypothetical protein QUR77_01285 [Arcobacter sp. DSM 115954]MCT7514222.1 hypothetical protein [Aliarcobacter cryaerophilus]WNL14839.1 hypothetical protein RJG51_01300 [Arcobacter sp. AZ-2023]WNL19278.1 hypothetical protein RJG53_00755 [Arcobacter sp. AZ-2023]